MSRFLVRACSGGAPLLAAMVVLLSVRPSRAYQRYNDGCNTCHGAFTTTPYRSPSGETWPSSLHEVHRSSSYMDTTCGLCHLTGDNRNPYTNMSDGTANTQGRGCVGCHGRIYAGSAEGWGLRAHHAAAGVSVCAGCHPDDGPPAPESMAPPYYGSPDTRADSPCNADGLEDWSGNGYGIDNDGDGLYDGVDPDCTAPTCGNGSLDDGETCDPPSSCPTSCDDGDACTADTLTGSAATCDAACDHTAVTACQDGDGCCPAACDATNDNDCTRVCGNDVVETGETCDPPSSCPTSCDDGDTCTVDTLTGSAATCDAACTSAPVTACQDGDGCCAPGCDATNDSDCTRVCGNEVIEAGETCDPPSSCPTSCDDGDACTMDTLSGSAATCDAACDSAPVSACQDGDGCCPAGCSAENDGDCSAESTGDVPGADAGDTAGGGCACSGSGTSGGGLLLLAGLASALLWRRRRDRTRRGAARV